MLKIKDDVTKEQLQKFGYEAYSYSRYIMTKSFGALTVYIHLDTHEIYGIGFYPVGNRIVLPHIKNLIDNGLVEQEATNA
jgi:hypothetical protein